MAYTPAAPLNRYALKRQSPLTQGAQLAEDQNTQGLQTGNFADVQSAQKATQRANAARSSQALQAARGTVARSGGDFSPQAAIRAQDIAFAGANAQNLDATNQANQLQRQYRQDALNRSDAYEQNAQSAAIGERNYQSNLDAAELSQKNQEVGFGFTDRQLGQTDIAQKNEMDRYNLSRGDQNRQFDVTTGLNQQQINNQNAQFDKTLGQRQNEFGVTSGQTQQQINNQSSQFNQTLGQRDREFGVTSGQAQQQINNQVDQFGQTLGQRQNEFGVTSAQTDRQLGQTDTAQANEMTRYNLTRGDQNSQFDATLGQRQNEFNVTSDQNQQQINNQVSQFDKNYGLDASRVDQSQQQIDNQAAQFNQSYGLDAARVDQSQQQINNQANQYNLSRGDQNAQFAVTSNQAQQQITNQAAQAAAQLGYNYASLSQQDQQFFQDLAQRQSEFTTTSAQTDRQLGQTDTAMQNEMDRYALTRGDTLDQNAIQNAQQDRLIGLQETRLTADTTDAQYQKTMDAISSIADPKAQSAAMAAYLRGDDVSQFISGTLYGSDGSLNKDFASASPAEQQYQATIDELKFTYPGKTDAEYQALATQRMQQADQVTAAPVQQQISDNQTAAYMEQLAAGNVTPEAVGAVKPSSMASIPTGSKTAEWLASNNTGGWVKFPDGAYQVIGGGKSGTTEYAELKTWDGRTVYLINGKVESSLPEVTTTNMMSPGDTTGRTRR
jgi:hypothetical protein